MTSSIFLIVAKPYYIPASNFLVFFCLVVSGLFIVSFFDEIVQVTKFVWSYLVFKPNPTISQMQPFDTVTEVQEQTRNSSYSFLQTQGSQSGAYQFIHVSLRQRLFYHWHRLKNALLLALAEGATLLAALGIASCLDFWLTGTTF